MNIYKFHTDPECLDLYEERLTRVPKLAYERAKSLLRRFPEGEAAIAKDAEYAYRYAKSFFKGRWMSECGVKHFSFVNSFDYEKSSPEAKDADLEKLRVCSTGYTKVLALGGFASSALNKLKIRHERLPHPSPRNRQFNDPAFEPAVVRRISEYLNENIER